MKHEQLLKTCLFVFFQNIDWVQKAQFEEIFLSLLLFVNCYILTPDLANRSMVSAQEVDGILLELFVT